MSDPKPTVTEKKPSSKLPFPVEKIESAKTANTPKQSADTEAVRDSDASPIEDTAEPTRENEVASQNTDVPPDDFMNETFPEDEPIIEDEQQLPDYMEEEPVQNSHTFWILFGITLPLTLILAVLFFGVFAAVWAALAALILAAIAALIAVAAVGTALSLVGIVYGISQLFLVMPIGLYEIGIGVICGSIAMFVGILLYNFAIRLIPFLMKLVGRLLVFLLKKLKTLFHYLRKECAKL